MTPCGFAEAAKTVLNSMCVQLHQLCTCLDEASSKLQIPVRQKPVRLTASFEGHVESNGRISLDTKALPCDEAWPLKMDWIRQSAPMPALHRAIQALLDAFWAQEPLKQGLDPNGCVQDGALRHGTRMSPSHIQGPGKVSFLDALKQPNQHQAQLQWKHVPSDLQETVQDWFLLFCFELSELGYCVTCDELMPSFLGRWLRLHNRYSIHLLG